LIPCFCSLHIALRHHFVPVQQLGEKEESVRCTSFGGPRPGLNTGVGNPRPVIIITILAQANLDNNYCTGTKFIKLYIMSARLLECRVG
jgi:hypothetical protein